MPLAGDQLVVDLSLGSDDLPPWSLLRIGDSVIEVTDQPHTGCAKFTKRFGLDAFHFLKTDVGQAMNLRGINGSPAGFQMSVSTPFNMPCSRAMRPLISPSSPMP